MKNMKARKLKLLLFLTCICSVLLFGIKQVNAEDKIKLIENQEGKTISLMNTEKTNNLIEGAIIPEGAIYTTKDGKTYNAGQEVPKYVIDGDKFAMDDYVYEYHATIRNFPYKKGWNVNTVADKNKTEYGTLYGQINGEPITNMYCTFIGCKSLTTAPVIPSSVTSMIDTFNGCTSLKTAPEIPNSVTDMVFTFYGCTSLTTAPKIPQGVTDMVYTFYDCTSLTIAPEIPSSVTNMYGTFVNCTSLTTAPVIPSSVTNMAWTFGDCTSLTNVVIPNSVTSIGYGTFNNCTNLTNIVIPNSVTSIGNSAFYGCQNLTILTNNSVAIDYAKKENIKYNIISYINPENTIKDVRLLFKGKKVNFYDKDGKELINEDSVVVTGMKAVINDIEEHILIVKGDLNGNGRIDDADLLKMLRYQVGLDKNIDIRYLLAADLITDESYADDKDLMKMLRVMVNLDTL